MLDSCKKYSMKRRLASQLDLIFLVADLHVPHHRLRFQQFFGGARYFSKVHTLFFPHLLLLRDYCLGDNFFAPSQCFRFAFFSFQEFNALICKKNAQHCINRFKKYGAVIYALDLISESDYLEARDFAFLADLSELAHSSIANVSLGFIARRDLSLICQSNAAPADLSEPSASVYRATILLVRLGLIAVQKLAALLPFSDVNRVFLTTDRYSVYLGAAYWAKNHGFHSGVIHADHVFENHLRVTDLEVYGAQKIALYNLQQVAGEFAEPAVMFEYAKEYIKNKLIRRSSTQAFSPKSDDGKAYLNAREYASSYEKTICYFTSSPDEQLHDNFSYPNDALLGSEITRGFDLYACEAEFLADVLEYASRFGLGVIIRIHPRMNPEGKQVFPSGLLEIHEAVSRYPENRFFVLEPQTAVSSYTLALLGRVNLFFWSTIGIELMMLGFVAMSPNARNSYTYYGYPFMHGDHPRVREAFFARLSECIDNPVGEFDGLYWAVRGFFIEHAASHFLLRQRYEPASYSISCRLRRGVLPWLVIKKLPGFTSSIRLWSFGPVFRQIVASASSVQYPKYSGYWTESDWSSDLLNYKQWLKDYALPALGADCSDQSPGEG